jgi:uncharacterized protein YacL
MSQSKTESIVEQILNVGSGLVISLLAWTLIINPTYDLQTKFQESVEITIIFTVISIVRGYFWRRHFNRKQTEKQKI